MWKKTTDLNGIDITLEVIAADAHGNFMCGTLAKGSTHDNYFVVDDSSMMTSPTHYISCKDLKASLKDFKQLEIELTNPRSTEEFNDLCSIELDTTLDLYVFKYKGSVHKSSKSKFDCAKAKIALQKALGV